MIFMTQCYFVQMFPQGLIMLWLFIFACVAVEIVSKDKELLSNPDTGAIVECLGVVGVVQLIGSDLSQAAGW